jgi:hypothetical protein
MAGVVVAHLGMTVEAKWDAIFDRLFAALGLWPDVVKFDVRPRELVAGTAMPAAEDENLVTYRSGPYSM